MARGKVLALIMAGGAGSRLELLTERRAKPALPYGGVYRLIDFPLSNCLHSGIADVWVVEQYHPYRLNEHLANGRPWDLDRTHGGLRVLPPYQSRAAAPGGFAEGNADAIYRNLPFLREFDPDILLVLSADHVYTLDYRAVVTRHREREADVTIVTTRVPRNQAGRFGNVTVDDTGRVTAFAYKPETPASDLATAEVFVYDARTLLDTLEELAGEAAAGSASADDGPSLGDFGDTLLPRFVQAGRAYEYRLPGYWKDLGTIGSYWEAHMDLLAPEPPLALDDPRWPILTHGVQRPPARIHAPARIENSLISPGCTIRGQVARSVLAPGVVVEEDAVVRNAIVLYDTVVGAGATVGCAILDREVRVGAEATVGRQLDGGAAARCGGKEIALVGRGARIADRATVAAGARVAPG